MLGESGNLAASVSRDSVKGDEEMRMRKTTMLLQICGKTSFMILALALLLRLALCQCHSGAWS